MVRYKDYITEVPNFPIKGVNFKDISPLLLDGDAFKGSIVELGGMVKLPDYWVGIDARGFILASALAVYFGGGVIMCRKSGKLPGKKVTISYRTEYSSDKLVMHTGSGDVVIVDDVLATGGTLRGANLLSIAAGYNIIGNLTLLDLKYVPRARDFDLNVRSLIEYE